jgi:uncharacterized membrane protein
VSAPQRGTMDPRVQAAVGNLLRAGVLVAVAVVLIGAVLFLVRHGQAPISYGAFHGVPGDLRHAGGMVREVFSGRGSGIIQLGLILLVATPVARVAMTVVAFALERDRTYVAITLIVLALLLFSLIG